MRKLRSKNNLAILSVSLRNLWVRVRSYVQTRDGGSFSAAFSSVLAATERYLTGLGTPLFKYKEIREDDAPDPVAFSNMTDDIASDLDTGYQELDNLNDLLVAAHNLGSIQADELKSRSDRIAGLIGDLNILSAQGSANAIVFGDNFADESKLDRTFSTGFMGCDTMPGQGALTLGHLDVASIGPDDVRIDVKPISPTTLMRGPTQEDLGRFYEGHYFALLGEAEPEGGVFHLTEQLGNAASNYTQQAITVPAPAGKLNKDGSRKFTKDQLRAYVVPGGQEARFLEQLEAGVFADIPANKLASFIVTNRTRYHRADATLRRSALYFFQHPNEGQAPSGDLPVTPDNIVLSELGASEDELVTSRKKMVDGDPASYWQCEFSQRSTVIQDKIAATQDATGKTTLSVEDIRNLVQTSDNADLEVEIIFTLNVSRNMNWITINPINFDDGCWLEVTDLATAPSLESEFTVIETFANRSAPNILTPQANEEIPAAEATSLLAPGQSSYQGLGVWPFASRNVKLVRVRLKQRSPSPNPYERIVIEATRSTTTKDKVA